jgi:squalene synthase HpnC
VRAADDIGDNPALGPEDKVARLDAFAYALIGPAEAAAALPKAQALRASLAQTGVTAQHALDLLAAFKRDATKLRYRDWQDLLGYCALSASPVGRFLLDLHGEERELYAYSDPLCDALQVLNHLQDCQDDYRALNRVYLPVDSFAAAGIEVTELDRSRVSPALREVLDRTLDGVDGLLETARHLPRVLASRRLAAESGVIVAIAQRLAALLRRRDPLAQRVELSKPQFLLCAIKGLGMALGPRRRVAQRTAPITAPGRAAR